MKELLLVIGLVVLGTALVKTYNDYEEPVASRAMRLAGVLPVELK